MSRIGKSPIPVPSGVDVTVANRRITVKGPKGSGRITVIGTKAGGVWSYETWQLKVTGREDLIPLSKE